LQLVAFLPSAKRKDIVYLPLYGDLLAITRQGFPSAIEFSGILFGTTLPAAIITLLPILTDGRMTLPAPIYTLSPISIGETFT